MTNYHKEIAPAQEAAHGHWLEAARDVAKRLSLKRGYITTDDIWDKFVPPVGVDKRIMGAIFRPRGEWEAGGYVNSRRKECHHRPVRLWKYRG